MRVALAASVLAATALIAVGQSSAEPTSRAANAQTPVTQSVLSPPRWYRGDDGRVHMQYELRLTNTVPLPIDVTSVEVRGGGRSIETLSGDRLEAAMSLLATPNTPTTRLAPSTVGIVWLDLSFANKRALPKRVNHRLVVDLGPGQPIGPTIAYTGARATVTRHGPTVIAPPLRGKRWAAVGGADGPHRRAILAVNGSLRLGQRFAIDFAARLDAEGRTHIGEADQNASYLNYGEPVLAVGAGKVVEAVDRFPDQIPNAPTSVPLEDADGNHVIVRLAKGVFAGYAHFKPGTVRVHRGEQVREGQVLGKLGNSGNSTGPHLHFQLMNRPSLADSDGLPFVIDRFRLYGRVPSLDALVDADREGTPVPIDPAGAGERRRRGLIDREIVGFRGG